MSAELIGLIAFAAVVGSVTALMRAQKPSTTAQQLIQQNRFEDAVGAAALDPFHRAEALKLLGRFDDAILAYGNSKDPAAKEGIALSLAHLGRELPAARRMMEETIALHPQIQEFQALVLAYIDWKAGDCERALRIYRDNLELLETRFRDDYTDRDPMLAETLWLFAFMAEADGDTRAAQLLRARAAEWAPGSIWAA